MSDHDELLRDALNQHATTIAFTPTPLRDVETAAYRMRGRRRAATVLMSAAAVVIVTIPVALFAARAPDTAPSQPSPSPTSPSSTSSTTGQGPQLESLPRGPNPLIGYLDAGTFVGPDGTRTRMPDRFGVSQIAVFGQQFLVADTRYFEGTNGLALLGPGSREDLGPCTSGGGAVTGDESLAAWATFGCTESVEGPASAIIHRRSVTGTDEQVIPNEPDKSSLTAVVGFLGQDVVYTRGFGQASYVTDLVAPPRQIPGIAQVTGIDESDGLLAGQLLGRTTEDAGVLDPKTGELLWHRQGLHILDFSPNGELVLGSAGDQWFVLDAGTGKPQQTLFEGLEVLGAVWETDQQLLAIVTERKDQAVVRSTVDGALSLASDTVARDRPGEQRFVLEKKP